MAEYKKCVACFGTGNIGVGFSKGCDFCGGTGRFPAPKKRKRSKKAKKKGK